MRQLLFKNLTSRQKKRKILLSAEISDKQGVRSAIQRHFVYIIKEVTGSRTQQPLPSLYVRKEYDSRQQKERFICKIKSSVYTVVGGRTFLVLFMNFLKIDVVAVPV